MTAKDAASGIKSHSFGDEDALLNAALDRIRNVDVAKLEATLQESCGGACINDIIQAFRRAHLFDGTKALPENAEIPETESPIDFFVSLGKLTASGYVSRYVMLHRGLNWRFTDYIFDPEFCGLMQRGRSGNEQCAATMDRAFCASPVLQAAQERFLIEKKILQSLVDRPDVTLASLPCGRMRDLLQLDYSHVNNRAHVFGIDLDEASLTGAADFARELGVDEQFSVLSGGSLSFIHGDALRDGFSISDRQHKFVGTLDVLHSAGLVMYLTDAECLSFFQNARASLKEGGSFVVSQTMLKSEWRGDLVPPEEILVERLVVSVVLQPMWTSGARTVAGTTSLLEKAGFTDIIVHKDSRSIFPTWVARK